MVVLKPLYGIPKAGTY
jgi:hypothetical protein